MNADDKDSIKDFIIISLIKTLAHTYSNNYNVDKHRIEKHLFRQLDQFNIFDTNIHTNIHKSHLTLFKNTLTSLNGIIPTNTQILNQNTLKSLNDITTNISILNQNTLKSLNDITTNTQILIGNGAFSNVYKIYNPLDDTQYALKKIGIGSDYTQSLIEVRAMAKLTHPNIVRYHMSWIESSDIEKKTLFSNPLLLDNNISKDFSNYSSKDSNNSSTYFSNLSNISIYDENNFDQFIYIQMELCIDTYP
jgi:hypothetical protein